jgi:hypothetical protein
VMGIREIGDEHGLGRLVHSLGWLGWEDLVFVYWLGILRYFTLDCMVLCQMRI